VFSRKEIVMASAALKIETGTEIPGEGLDETQHLEQTERDFEAEAKEHGWVPKDDFKGDVSRWVDAETFMKRADEMMPLLKAQNARQKREIEQLKKDFKRAATQMETMEKRAFERAQAELEEKHRMAVEAGDVKGANDAVKELRDLKPAEPGWAAGKSADEIRREATEALADFRDENAWYDKANLASASETEINARLYFDRMCDKHVEQTKQMAPGDFFAMVRDMVVEKFPQLTAKPSREKPLSPVAGATTGKPRGSSKSWDNLPPEAKRSFERMQGRGIWGVTLTGDKDKDMAASRAYYAKHFDWEGYQQ
jgi:hypothetical protein